MGRGAAFAVALIGPDGAGKTTVARRLPRVLPVPATYLYMGVNLDASPVMLPTTRLALALKRRSGGRRDMLATSDPRRDPGGGRLVSRLVRSARRTARLANWTLEEWYRQLLAWRALRSGRIVIFDRHFLADYYAADISDAGRQGRPLLSRIHGFLLSRIYPRPELVICLDAPAQVLWDRKAEGSLAYLEQRRQDYLAMRDLVDEFVVIDAAQPVDEVLRQAGDSVMAVARRRKERAGSPR